MPIEISSFAPGEKFPSRSNFVDKDRTAMIGIVKRPNELLGRYTVLANPDRGGDILVEKFIGETVQGDPVSIGELFPLEPNKIVIEMVTPDVILVFSEVKNIAGSARYLYKRDT